VTLIAQSVPVNAWTLRLRLLRPHQWVKSAFVVAPLVFSRTFLSPDLVAGNLAAAVLFCIASSAAYIVNDFFDREADRRHPVKRRRPLAAGEISSREALRILAVLLAILTCGLVALPVLAPGIVGYLLLALLYSWKFKHWVWVDIVALAAAFVLRVETGILAIGSPASPWMLSATAFLALYLAAVKRREELIHLGVQARAGLSGYGVEQLDAAKMIAAMAAAASYAVFAVTIRPALIPTILLIIAGIGRFELRVRTTGGECAARVVLGDWLLMACLLAWTVMSAVALL
jgi:4-hydroxybenzoate polyprenyltransferase